MNRNLFAPSAGPPPDTQNNAGGAAYSMPPKEALAQLACTGFFADTFYVSAEKQLDEVLAFAKQCDDAFVAQVARYARHAGFMKDMPAVLLAHLFGKRSPSFTFALFTDVIDNVKMLSGFVMAVRSGKFGRRSLGSQGSRFIESWLLSKPLDYLWRQSIAKDPSLGDIIKLAHPSPQRDEQRAALYRLLVGKPMTEQHTFALPPLVKQTIAFRADQTLELPAVPFNMIDSVPLTTAHWRQLFEHGGFMFTRMNLATAQRQGVFADDAMVKLIASRLSDREQVLAARQFPYQLLLAYKAAMANAEMPTAIRSALHAAMEHATASCPVFPGRVIVAVDCSGSMSGAATGQRGDATSAATYADIAALFAACVLRRNPDTRVMTFANDARFVPVDPNDTVMTTAQRLAKAGGGTDASAPLRMLAAELTKFDLFILISDNESWLDSSPYALYRGAPGSVSAWDACKRVNPNARQVRINISPNATDQLPKRDDTLRVGGFSDAVFSAIASWCGKSDWVACVEAFGR